MKICRQHFTEIIPRRYNRPMRNSQCRYYPRANHDRFPLGLHDRFAHRLDESYFLFIDFQDISPQLRLNKGVSVENMDACFISRIKNVDATLMNRSEETLEGGKRSSGLLENAADAVISNRVHCAML